MTCIVNWEIVAVVPEQLALHQKLPDLIIYRLALHHTTKEILDYSSTVLSPLLTKMAIFVSAAIENLTAHVGTAQGATLVPLPRGNKNLAKNTIDLCVLKILIE